MAFQILLALLGGASFIVALVIIEALRRKAGYSPEHLRRFSHVIASLFAAVFGYILEPVYFLVLIALFIPVMLVSRRFGIFNHIHKVKRKTFGEELLVLGIIGAFLLTLSSRQYFISAMLVTAFADSLGGEIVSRRGRIAGFLGFFVITAAILVLGNPSQVSVMLLIALAAATIERLSPYGTDNLTVPVVVAATLMYFT